MAGELHGRLVLASVDVGSSTWTPFASEIQSVYTIEGGVDQAVNKSTTAAAGADYAQGARHLIEVSGHVSAATKDPAFDKVMTDRRTNTKTPTRFIEPAPYDTYEGSVVWENVGSSAPNEFYTKSCRGQFDGLPAQTATA